MPVVPTEFATENISLKNFELALKLDSFTFSLFPFVDFSSLIYKFSESRI